MSAPDALVGGDAVTPARRSRRILEAALLRAPRLAIPPGALDQLEEYVGLLLEANARVNLTRITDPPDVAIGHLLDSLAALPLLDAAPPDRAIDLGSGGGAPAIPLAIARPGVRWLLVESVEKKARQLTLFARALRLGNVEVAARRAEEVGHDERWRARVQLVTARACAALPVLAELALPLLAPGGRLIAWKGPLGSGDDEVRRASAAAGQLGGGAVRVERSGIPELGGHTFAIITKVSETPAVFPRRPGLPGRRPLG